MSEFIVVLTTTDREGEAARIATALVERHQAACVNVIPAVRSYYRWKNKTVQDAEQILLIKTASGMFDAVCRTIKELHGYELPDILSLPIPAGDEKSLQWIRDCLGGTDKPSPAGPDSDPDA